MTGKGQKLAPLELMVIILLVNSVQLLVLATFLRYIYIYSYSCSELAQNSSSLYEYISTTRFSW